MNTLTFNEKQAIAMLRGGASFHEAAQLNRLDTDSLMKLWSTAESEKNKSPAQNN